MIQERILELTEYGRATGLLAAEDVRYTVNRLLELFGIDELEDSVSAAYAKREPMTQMQAEEALEGILAEMLDHAAACGLLPENTITYRDLFDTKMHERADAKTKRGDPHVWRALSPVPQGGNRLFL